MKLTRRGEILVAWLYFLGFVAIMGLVGWIETGGN